MTSKFESDFCGGQFWNLSLTWNSEHPDFTNCFQKTVLCWTPITVFLFFCFFELPKYFSPRNVNRHIPWNVLNITKLVVTASLVVVNVAEIIEASIVDSDVDELTNVSPADYLAAVIFLLSYVLSFGLLWLSLRYGIRTSPSQFMFYFASVVCEGVNFRSVVRRKTHPEQESPPVSEDGTNRLLYLLSFQYGFLILLFMLNLFTDQEPKQYDEKLKSLDNLCPELSASFPSKLTFFWATPLMWKGFRNPLESSMLWSLHPRLTSRGIVPLFSSFLGPAIEKVRRKNLALDKSNDQINVAKVSVFLPLVKAFGTEFFMGSFLKVFHDCLVMASPQIMKLMIDFVEIKYCNDSDPEKHPEPCDENARVEAYNWKGYFYGGLMLVTTIFQSILLGQYFERMSVVGMNVRTALISTIYRKSLLMSSSARKESTAGEIVNLMSVDVQRFMVRNNYLILNINMLFQYVHTNFVFI